MKSVLILRHAKSSWKHPEQNDHERPLNKRGKRDASLLGSVIKNENLLPEFVISSDAKRASSTAKMVAKAAGYKGEIGFNKSLYEARPMVYIDVLHDLSNEYVRVLIVGHNPGVEELAGMLTQEEHELSTCSLVHVKLPINKWGELDYNTKGKLLGIWHPRDLT